MLEKASRKKMFAKIGIFGETGSGKSLSALRLAQGLCGGLDQVAIIDTENRLGIHIFLPEWNREIPSVENISGNYSPIKVVEALQECFNAGVKCVIIDTITSTYNHVGGMMEMANSYRTAKGVKDTRAGWIAENAKFSVMVEQIKHAPCHIICVMRGVERQKEEEVDGYGKSKKFAIQPQIKKEFPYELQCNFCISLDTHKALALKDNTNLYADEPIFLTEEVGKRIGEWCLDGVESKSTLREQCDYYVGQIKNLIVDDEIQSAQFGQWLKGKAHNEKFLSDLKAMFDRKITNLSKNEDELMKEDTQEYTETDTVPKIEPVAYSPETLDKIETFKSFAPDDAVSKLQDFLKQNPDEKTLLTKMKARLEQIEVQAETLAIMITNSGAPITELMDKFDVEEKKFLNHPKVKAITDVNAGN